MGEPESLLTVGELARRLGRPVHAIEYLIRSRGIKPCGRAGNARVFSQADLQFIEGELRRIAEEHGKL